MNRTVITKAVLAMAVILIPATGRAQMVTGEKSFARSEYENVLRRNFWQDASNPVGIRQDTSVTRSADASLAYEVKGGGFYRTNEARHPSAVKASAASLVHLKRFSLQGAFSFEQMQGNDMCGSIFVNPGFYPIDVLEFTPGRKTRQTYAFDGSISVDLTPELRIGGGIDFTSSNYSKRKDLRHSNYLLDLTVSPGLIWHRGKFALGLNAIVRKTSDTPTGRQVGTKDTFDAFLDKGLMFGNMGIWDGSSIHLSEAGVSGLPLSSMFYGAALQLQSGEFFTSLDYRYGSGKAGEKEYIWYSFPSHNIAWNFGERWEGRRFEHVLRASVGYQDMKNYETIIDKVSEGGVTTVHRYGSNRIFSRRTAEYELEYGFEDHHNEFELGAGLENELSTASQMYPYVARENLVCWSMDAAYTRKIADFTITAALGYRQGTVGEIETEVSEESGVTSAPFRLEEWYLKDIEYKTSPRICAGLSVSCDIWRGIYVKLSADYTHAFRLSVLPGADRYVASVGLGYRF